MLPKLKPIFLINSLPENKMPSGPAITMKKKIESAREIRKGAEVFIRSTSDVSPKNKPTSKQQTKAA